MAGGTRGTVRRRFDIEWAWGNGEKEAKRNAWADPMGDFCILRSTHCEGS